MNFSMSLYSSFFQITKQKRNDIFLTYGDQTYTYHDVLMKSLQIAGYLLHCKIEKGSRIALMLPSSPEFFFIVLALSRLECTVVPIDPHFKALAIRHIVNDSNTPFIIFHKDYEGSVQDAIDILDNLKSVISVGGKAELTDYSIDDHLSHAPYGGPFSPESEQEAAIFYSSGTSGPSKGGIFTNRQLIFNAQSFNESMILHESEILCARFPLHHFWGFTTVLVSSLIKGNSVILLNSVKLPPVPENSRGAILNADPDFYEELSESKEPIPEKVLYGITAGGHLKPDIQLALYETFHFPVFRGYGLVEAGPVILINNDVTKLRSIGIPLHNISVLIKDGEKIISPPNIGELCIRQEWVVSALTHDTNLLKDVREKGWFRTGDLCYQDIDGYIYFVDRKENRIRINGFDMFPEGAENILKKHTDVKQAALVGVPVDNLGNEKCIAYIVPEKVSKIDVDTLRNYLAGKIPAYQIPSDFVIVNHLPVGATGKISRQMIRRNAIQHYNKNINLSSKPEDDL